MNRTHTAGLSLFALVVFVIGMATTGGADLFGKSLTTVLLPSSEPVEALEADDLEVLATADLESPEALAVDPTSGIISDEVVRHVIDNVERIQPLPVEQIDGETLWLARVIYSETKQPQEMELVAWVVRNRVETGYRGNASYRSAVLDPYQFSAFNPGDRKRQHYSNLTHRSYAPGFDRALSIAHTVRHAGENFRPFGQTTRHFYSERSMVGVRHPAWAKDGVKVDPKRSFTLDERRFRFFADVR